MSATPHPGEPIGRPGSTPPTPRAPSKGMRLEPAEALAAGVPEGNPYWSGDEIRVAGNPPPLPAAAWGRRIRWERVVLVGTAAAVVLTLRARR